MTPTNHLPQTSQYSRPEGIDLRVLQAGFCRWGWDKRCKWCLRAQRLEKERAESVPVQGDPGLCCSRDSLCRPQTERVPKQRWPPDREVRRPRCPVSDSSGWALVSLPAQAPVGAAQRKARLKAHPTPCRWPSGPFSQEYLSHASLCPSHREKSNHRRGWKAPVGFISEFTLHRTAMWEAKYIRKAAGWAWNQTIGIIKSKFLFFFF